MDKACQKKYESLCGHSTTPGKDELSQKLNNAWEEVRLFYHNNCAISLFTEARKISVQSLE